MEILEEPQSDAVSGKWFSQKGQRMGDKTEKKGWGKRERRGQESRRIEGKLEKRDRREIQRGKEMRRRCKVRREKFKRMRKRKSGAGQYQQRGPLVGELPSHCF